MVFSSITFLFYFLPIVLVIYYISPKKFRNLILLISSMLFYFFGEPKYGIIMVLSIISIYFHGIWIEKERNTKYKKVPLISGIIISLAVLFYFKYFDFLIENINLFLSKKIDLFGIILPIGISFYTFQMISYLVDVYRGNTKVQKNFIKLATYISLFPQLIAGPIVRYSDIEKQLDDRTYTFEKFSLGVRRFVIGLSKKVLIANILGELVKVFGMYNDETVLFYWLYGIANMLQIYFDFSGYSDMAIGLGKMLGFEFLENFNYPYISSTITEFWRRWHISLSSFFRDYVYIPLGGNRVSKIKWIRNLLIVWFLTGLWHGAAWNFVIWGLMFGVLLILEKTILKNIIEKIPKVIKHIFVLLIVMISFIIFSGSKIDSILEEILGLFGIGTVGLTSNLSTYYLKSYFITLLIGIIGSTPLIKIILNKLELKIPKILNILEIIVMALLLIICTAYIIDGSFNPFLYFRF